jgi:hypothetical protein
MLFMVVCAGILGDFDPVQARRCAGQVGERPPRLSAWTTDRRELGQIGNDGGS